ncbi:MAG: Lrp/AsnC family transcriptional regulator [Myxococcales bacterium]|nr:Lrp/AsnC family transcriptional regulator [Myxococcales bacterium]
MADVAGLDAIDRKILRLVQQHGRMTNAALAEAVGLTPTPMLQRMRKLEQAGVIERYAAIVDPAKVGRPVLAFVHVTLKSHEAAVHAKLLSLVKELPEVVECHHIAGEEDFLLKVAMKSIPELEHLLFRLGGSGVIARIKTTFVLSSAKSSSPIHIDEGEEAKS